jgi:hypothetical protein
MIPIGVDIPYILYRAVDLEATNWTDQNVPFGNS